MIKMQTPEQEVRSSITTTTNVTAGYDATFGVEIKKEVDKRIVDILNNQTPIRNMIPRKSMNGQLTYNWNIRDLNNDSSTFYSEGASGTAGTGSKVQLIALALSFRTDWEVTGLFQAATASYYNAVADEVNDAAVAHGTLEEKQIITGIDAGGLGDVNGFLGIKQIVQNFPILGDTQAIYGQTRGGGLTFLDAAVVAGGANALDLTELDEGYTAIVKSGGQPGFILASPDKADEINQLLQAQQRFQGTLEIEGGFTVATYRGIPIVTSIYMDTAGAADTDTVIYVLGANVWEMRVLLETTNVMATQARADAVGGYLKTYEVLVCKDLTKNTIINDLTV